MKKLLLLSALLIFACSSDSEGNPCIYEPTLSTEAITDITETSATLNGIIAIISENCDVPNNAEQGFVYSTEIQPTLEDIQVNVNGTNISTTIEGLVPNTTYYVRSFLTNNLGDFYGNEMEFTTTEEVCDVVYLDENGVTIKACDDANIGDVGTINGVEYTVVDREMLDVIIYEGFDLNNNQFINDVTKVCTSKITDMEALFATYPFNQDISNWDVSNVDTMRSLFSQTPFNQDISKWDVSSVTDMEVMFAGSIFNQDISNWDVGNVNDMSYMFTGSAFNQDISNWNVSNVTEMNGMFRSVFNQPIGNWDVSNVIDMSLMFEGSQFNQDIGNWNVSNVFNMERMFFGANYFNQDIGNWDTSSVNNMHNMFEQAADFNQPIGDWNVSNVTYMISMFYEADTFNQDISNWDVGNVLDCTGFSYNTPQWTLPQPNFTNCNPN